MTSLDLAIFQGTVLILVAPVCARIGTTLVTLVKEKVVVMPWVAYQREPSVLAAVAFGTTTLFAVLLPLMGFAGLAGTDGNVFALIAVLALVGGTAGLLDQKTVIPQALCAFGTVLLALGLAASSIDSSDMLLAMSGVSTLPIVLTVVAAVLVLVALRLDDSSERVRDVNMLLRAVLSVFVVNLIAMMTAANLLTSEVLALNILILAGKALGAAVVIEILVFGIRKYSHARARRFANLATFLAILSIIATVWHMTPTL